MLLCSARICKRLRSPGIDSEESTAHVAWESIPGLLKKVYKNGLRRRFKLGTLLATYLRLPLNKDCIVSVCSIEIPLCLNFTLSLCLRNECCLFVLLGFIIFCGCSMAPDMSLPSPSPLFGPERSHGSPRLPSHAFLPSLRDVAHDGVLCTFSNGVVRQGRRHGPSIAYKITPCWVTLLRPARRAAVLGQPSSLRPIGHNTVKLKIIYFKYSSGLPGLNCSAYLLIYFSSL